MIPAVLVLDAIFLLVVFVDLFSVTGANRLTASRKMLRIASLGKPHEVEIELINKSAKKMSVTVKDDLPDCFKATPASFDTVIEPRSRAIFDYKINSDTRGKYSMNFIFVKVLSRLKLWNALYQMPVESLVYVCLLYTSPSPRDRTRSRMPSSA